MIKNKCNKNKVLVISGLLAFISLVQPGLAAEEKDEVIDEVLTEYKEKPLVTTKESAVQELEEIVSDIESNYKFVRFQKTIDGKAATLILLANQREEILNDSTFPRSSVHQYRITRAAKALAGLASVGLTARLISDSAYEFYDDVKDETLERDVIIPQAIFTATLAYALIKSLDFTLEVVFGQDYFNTKDPAIKYFRKIDQKVKVSAQKATQQVVVAQLVSLEQIDAISDILVYNGYEIIR